MSIFNSFAASGGEEPTAKSISASNEANKSLRFNLSEIPKIWWIKVTSGSYTQGGLNYRMVLALDCTYTGVSTYYNNGSTRVPIDIFSDGISISKYSSTQVQISLASSSVYYFDTGLSYTLYYID